MGTFKHHLIFCCFLAHTSDAQGSILVALSRPQESLTVVGGVQGKCLNPCVINPLKVTWIGEITFTYAILILAKTVSAQAVIQTHDINIQNLHMLDKDYGVFSPACLSSYCLYWKKPLILIYWSWDQPHHTSFFLLGTTGTRATLGSARGWCEWCWKSHSC